MEAIKIWGDNIPYNVPGKAKKDAMLIKQLPPHIALEVFFEDVFGSHIAADASGFDTFTYLDEIKTGKASEYFDDTPVLYPFLAKDSDTAVIIAPGGGFCMKSREGEGYAIAEFLNANGITAFVLEYRINPYEAPVCYLDMQRAIRYVRYHAAEFGINPEKIGAMGFSAGGYVTAASKIFLGNKPVEYPGYITDEVDGVDGRANFIGLIYPVTNFDENPNMLCLLAGDDYFDSSKRPALQSRHSLTENLTKDSVPQFLCYGTQDALKGMDRYDERLQALQIPHKTFVLEDAAHGFAVEDERYDYWRDEFAKWIKDTV